MTEQTTGNATTNRLSAVKTAYIACRLLAVEAGSFTIGWGLVDLWRAGFHVVVFTGTATLLLAIAAGILWTYTND